ncbi:MAG: BolA family transcriptional regulator [Alphaproteobacteria bacterium]|nr:BolA family transcriptional regulator [Alphaproteobacteria bacterium]OJV16294.1 MAG: hypothetical protein BGO27_02970 [Alphaproteobacteria bacterium 33-17]
MPVSYDQISELLTKNMPDAKWELIDMVGDNNHWSLTITSEHFKGKPRVMQHKMVNEALKTILGGDLHALKITTKTEG